MGLFVPVTSLTANHDILRRRRTAPRIVAHSRKCATPARRLCCRMYIHAHVAHLTAAAAASLGREDDAKSLFRFAKKAGESAVVEQLAGTERGEKARRGGSFKRSVPASSPGGSGWDGEAGVVGADSLQRQVGHVPARRLIAVHARAWTRRHADASPDMRIEAYQRASPEMDSQAI
eukprot:1557280-Rhodomonas_salina.1